MEKSMKEIRIRKFDHIADLFCCMLLGAAISAACFPYLNLDTGIAAQLLLMAVDIALVLLLSYRWWVIPAVLFGVAVIVVCGALLFNVAEQLFAYLDGFVRWCLSSYPRDARYAVEGGMTLLRILAGLPIAEICYLYFKRLFVFAVLPPIALFMLVWLHLEKSLALIPVLVLLLCVLLIGMAKTTGRQINRKLAEGDRIPGALLEVFAIAVLPAILLCAFAFSPEKDGQLQSEALVRFVEDLGDVLDGRDENYSAMRTFDIGKSGFSPLGDRLGGDITLDNTVVMRVRTSMPMRLTGAVFDTYDGSSWTDAGGMGGYRYMGAFFQGKRREVFGVDKPYGGKKAKDLYYKVTSPLSLNISYDAHGNTVFYAGMLQSVKRSDFDAHQTYYNRQAELITKKVQWSLHYTLETVAFNRGAKDFDQNMLALEAVASAARDKSMEGINAYYLQLPEALPASVYEAAQRITQGLTTPYEKAIAIERWLNETCIYTLTPGTPPEDRDFVAYFLETKKGYCVYYASALTVLARCAGLPARYVTGFALKQDPELTSSFSYVATNATAHAWTQIYFAGIGWVDFDATGWNFFEPTIVEDLEYDDIKPQRPSKNTGAQQEESGPAQTQAQVDAAGEHGISPGVKITLISVLSLVLAAAIWMGVRVVLLLTDGKRYYKRMQRQHTDRGQRLDACYTRIVRQLAFWGIRQEAGDTIATFAARADRCLGATDMATVCGPVMRMRFGLMEPLEADVESICALSAALEARLRRELGLMRYLWRRIVVGR